LREADGARAAPVHRVRGTDPNWRFEQIVAEERRSGATGSTFFVLAAHHDPHDGAAPETYDELRPRLVETIRETGAEVGLHGSYTAADDPERLANEKATLEALAGQLPVIATTTSAAIRIGTSRAPFVYDTTLGFPDAVGFRAGIARPFHPWDFERGPAWRRDRGAARRDGCDARRGALPRAGSEARRAQLLRLLDWAAENGGAFAILWHPDRFDPLTSGGWDRLYSRVLEAAVERGGTCVPAVELVSSHSTWSK
jgi:peptidoglycan/xylan/chitin deacetylase (PgdA/CDA1 family)